MVEYRYDTGGIQNYEISPEGYMRAFATTARIGVQDYYNADGSKRRELRPPEEVANPESLASFGLKSLTVDHPPKFLNADNTGAYQVGMTDSTVLYKHGFVNVVVNVTDAEAIRKIKSGEKQQLSAGYTCELDYTPGVWRGKKYDAIQRNIRVNHISAVTIGRAGKDVKVHVDSVPLSKPISNKSIAARLDDKTYEVKAMADEEKKTDVTPSTTTSKEDELRRRITELEARVDDRDSIITSLKTQLETLKTETEQLKTDAVTARNDLDSHKKTYSNTISAEVSARIDAWGKAKPFLPKALAETPDPNMTSDEIKRAAVENTHQGVKLDSASSETIDGWFQSMLHGVKKKDKNRPIMQAVKNSFGAGTKDARAKSQEEDDKAWQTSN